MSLPKLVIGGGISGALLIAVIYLFGKMNAATEPLEEVAAVSNEAQILGIVIGIVASVLIIIVKAFDSFNSNSY